ncbi:MAG TPA: FAD-dependent oxidoreductase [Chitinophagales bacterium]|nr:FAD-dependent oxidoreductase [Chitinophagales bacterium]
MKTEPIWNINESTNSFKCLNREISVDVAIIGGGITGITTAQLLKNQGFKVAVLEARQIGHGTTGQSTGNLYMLTEYSLQQLHDKYDLETIGQVTQARKEAMEHIQNNVQSFNMECDYQKQSMFLFESESKIDIEKELSIASEIGIPLEPLIAQDFPFNYDKGFVLKNQAQFNPLTYTQQLAEEINDDNCEIFEDSCIFDIEEDDDFVYLKTENNKVKARFVVHATHTPKGLLVQYHTTLGPYREYGIGVKLKNNAYPKGIFWGQFNDRKYSVRTYGDPENPYLLCIGCMHKVGQAEDNTKNIKDLEDFAKRHFEVESINFVWGGQNYKSADMLPYIGLKTSGSKEYIATGFSTDGLVYGTVAAKIISDAIAGLENPFSEIFKANRHQPLKAALDFTKETVNVVGKLVGDFFKEGEEESIDSLLPDEGKLLQYKDEKCAVYKSSQGEVTVLSPICPHMGCTVDWNKAEKTWDCPCHGSRFDTAGRVIEGPAFHGLKRIE